jgi:hypothetical protein
VLPAKTILAFIALVCAALFFLNIFRRTWTLPLVGLGLLGISALIIGGIYPAVVQQFQVRPNEPGKEAPYISRNIQATRDAYNLSNVQSSEYSAVGQPDAESLAADRGTLDNIRLLDPAIVSPTFRQLQQIRTFYSFRCPGCRPLPVAQRPQWRDREHPGSRPRRGAGGAAQLGQRHPCVHPRIRPGRGLRQPREHRR